jgi:hypothetical protein
MHMKVESKLSESIGGREGMSRERARSGVYSVSDQHESIVLQVVAIAIGSLDFANFAFRSRCRNRHSLDGLLWAVCIH